MIALGSRTLPDAYILGPEVVAQGFAELAKDAQYSCNIAWPIGVAWVARNADKATFGERTGGSGLLASFRKPAMG